MPPQAHDTSALAPFLYRIEQELPAPAVKPNAKSRSACSRAHLPRTAQAQRHSCEVTRGMPHCGCSQDLALLCAQDQPPRPPPEWLHLHIYSFGAWKQSIPPGTCQVCSLLHASLPAPELCIPSCLCQPLFSHATPFLASIPTGSLRSGWDHMWAPSESPAASTRQLPKENTLPGEEDSTSKRWRKRD